MTTQFFSPPTNFESDRVRLPEEEASHAVKVLRLKPGDEIIVVDGAGRWVRAQTTAVSRSLVEGVILEERRGVGEPPFELRIGLALLKNPKRYDHFLEKAVELGATGIVPLFTSRTEKKAFNKARAEKRLRAALKQCGRSKLPVLADPVPLAEVLSTTPPGLICHEGASAEQSLLSSLNAFEAARGISVLIGPEGGFSSEECAQAQQKGWKLCSLGTRRLRAETAAITAVAAVMMHQDYHLSNSKK